MTTLRLLSPLTGVVRPVSAVPDPVFAEGMVGPGLAIEPQHVQTPDRARARRRGRSAPCTRTPSRSSSARAATILVHLGIDTVGLAGQGFTLHVDGGQTVRAGDRLVTWSPVDVSAAGLATICPVVALQADPDLLTCLVADGETVAGRATRCSTGPDRPLAVAPTTAARWRSSTGGPMAELLVDFITSLDGYASAEGWPGWWGLEGPEYLDWLARVTGGRLDDPDGRHHVPADVAVRRGGRGRRRRAGRACRRWCSPPPSPSR